MLYPLIYGSVSSPLQSRINLLKRRESASRRFHGTSEFSKKKLPMSPWGLVLL